MSWGPFRGAGRTIAACQQQPLMCDRRHVGDSPDREGSQRPVEAALEVSQAILEGLPPRRLLLLANAPSGATFSEHDVTLVQLFASQAAVAIDYSRARSAMQRVALIEDRERIARELHDGVVQALFGVGLNLQAATTMAEDPGLRQRLEEAIHKIDEVVQDLRNYVFELRPSVLADRRLDQAIRRVAADFADRSHVAIETDLDEQVAAALSSRAEHRLQLTSEGLSNVVRHADASHCRLSLRREGELAVLEVVDDGRGFDPGSEVESGHGLR